jgi:signal transduction histidine kinase
MNRNKRSDESTIAAGELILQNQEPGQSTAELIIANQELSFELVFQSLEKRKRAAELVIANIELNFQELEREKRAAELIIANIELSFQNGEKAKRAAELVIANEELVFQNREKEKRAAELVIANEELVFQNGEKEKRAAELVIANEELVFQNGEKQNRAAELVAAKKELFIQNLEKGKREEAEAKKDEFFNMVSHELKTPLTNIKAINQLLEKTTDKTARNYSFILKANHNIKRLERLIGDLLDVTKINSGKADLIISEFSFSDMLKQSVSSVQQLALGHRIILKNSVNLQYKADEFRLEQVMINLLTNAIKYSPNADRVLVTAKTEPGHVVVCVTDYGIGIAQKDIDHLFDRFFRVNEVAMVYEGLGL